MNVSVVAGMVGGGGGTSDETGALPFAAGDSLLLLPAVAVWALCSAGLTAFPWAKAPPPQSKAEQRTGAMAVLNKDNGQTLRDWSAILFYGILLVHPATEPTALPGETLDIIMLGDVIGQPGRQAVARLLSGLAAPPDLVVANVENVAHGFGVGERHIEELARAGVNVFSGGNHTFDRKEIFDFIGRHETLLRPANYPEGTPGQGHCLVQAGPCAVAVVNLMGRVFMEPLESPFLVAERLISELSGQAAVILVDIHAEATSEKVAMGWYLDGRVSAVVGTHTHVQTADNRILPGGTAYITDLGCCGPADGIIGMEREGVFRRLIKQLPTRFEVAPGRAMVNGVRIQVDAASGKARSIERIHEIEPAAGRDEEA